MGCLQVSMSLPIQPPPPDFNYLCDTKETSRRLVSRSFPQLADLVEDGTLVALERPSDYVERRSDGYQQPLQVWLVGTSHMSRLSAQHVQRVMTAVQPQNVVVELCRSRAGLMNEIPESFSKGNSRRSQPNFMSITGQNAAAALGYSLDLGGQSAMALRLILGLVSEKLSSESGVPSGEEFRAARRAAEEIGAQIVLGDRPIEITLQRAWTALKWVDKLKLLRVLLMGISSPKLDVTEKTLQSLKSDSVLSAMFDYLGEEFPELLQPLIHERDMYLAWSLIRSKAVNGSELVVGVIGQGHMKGVIHAIKYNKQTLRFRDLVGVRRSSEGSQKKGYIGQVMQNLVVDTVIGFILWYAYDYVSNSYDISSILSNVSFHFP